MQKKKLIFGNYILNKNNRISSIIEIFSKVEKYFLPSYDILPEKTNEIFPQIIGCVEDIIQRIVPQVNILRLRHFLTLSLDFFESKINDKLNEFKIRILL